MLIAVLLATTACLDSIGSVEPPILVDPPLGFTVACERPVLLPSRSLTQAEVESFWISDRSNLISCGLQLQALIDFYVKRDTRITNT